MLAPGAEIIIEKLIPEGKALGRLPDGRVVIAGGPVPGDRIGLDAVAESKGLVTVHAFRLLAPSPLRITPVCPVQERCGGCDWMVMSIAEQRRQKLEILREALLRTGRIDWRDRPLPLFEGSRELGYRGRIRLQVAGDRIGFYHRGSHELVEPEHCAVGSSRVNAALGELRALTARHPGALDPVAWLEVREATDGSVSVLLEGNATPRSPATERWLEAVRARFLLAWSSPLAGVAPVYQRFQLTERTYMLGAAQAFVQVNWEVNQALIAQVLSGAASRGARTFLDAYAGAGNFTLPLLEAGLSGLSVESNRSAVIAARQAAREQGLAGEGFVVADAAEHARELARQGRAVDLVLVDPPRAGLKAGLEPLARAAGRWFVMCSCNPVTLARDLARLRELGFELEELQAFDMFPQTHHLETLAWLRAPAGRAGAGSAPEAR